MTRNEYLNDLRRKLVRLPQSERDEAMAFYYEYFEDAGDDAQVIETLGSPIRLAAQINAEYSARMLEERHSAFKESPPPAQKEEEPYTNDLGTLAPPSHAYTRQTYYGTQAPPPAGQGGEQPPNSTPYTTPAPKRSSLGWIWAVILGIFALPVALPVLVVVIALVIVVVAVCFVVVVSLIALVVALLVGSVYTLFGIGTLPFAIGGWTAVGGAIALLGLALILIPLVAKFCIWLVGAIAKFVTRIFNNLKRRAHKDEEQ